MLTLEICRRAGTELRANDRAALLDWLARLADAGEVIEYRADTCQGWRRVPRAPDDADIVRSCAGRRRRRR